MLRFLGLAVALQIMPFAQALACDGQVGNVVFEDKFEDDSGGWEYIDPTVTFKPSEMTVPFDTKNDYISTLNTTFHATDGDYCLEFYGQPSLGADNPFRAAVQLWATDYTHLIRASLYSDGRVTMKAVVGNNNSSVYEGKVDSYKTDPTAVNTIRIIAKAGKLTLFVNGQQLKTVRAQVPDGALRFGFYADVDKVIDHNPPGRFKSYKVTAGE